MFFVTPFSTVSGGIRLQRPRDQAVAEGEGGRERGQRVWTHRAAHRRPRTTRRRCQGIQREENLIKMNERIKERGRKCMRQQRMSQRGSVHFGCVGRVPIDR